VACLRAALNNPATLVHACTQLAERVSNAAAATEALQADAVAALVSILSYRASLVRLDVQRAGLFVLCRLAAQEPRQSIREQMIGALGVATIVLQTHFEDAGLVTLALTLIQMLVSVPNHRRDLGAASDGLAAVLHAMNRHPHDVLVQENGCVLLQTVVSGDAAAQQAVARQGGPAALVRALSNHSAHHCDHPVLFLQAISCLTAMASDCPEARQALLPPDHDCIALAATLLAVFLQPGESHRSRIFGQEDNAQEGLHSHQPAAAEPANDCFTADLCRVCLGLLVVMCMPCPRPPGVTAQHVRTHAFGLTRTALDRLQELAGPLQLLTTLTWLLTRFPNDRVLCARASFVATLLSP
jgi:hypothetical protein